MLARRRTAIDWRSFSLLVDSVSVEHHKSNLVTFSIDVIKVMS
jgi:hypothetical protein